MATETDDWQPVKVDDWKPVSAEKAGEPSTASKLLSPITDIPKEIYEAGSSAVTGINENLNPLSEARNAKLMERYKNGPSLSGAWEDFKDTGKGLLSIPELITSPLTGAARSLIGHPFAAATGQPYEKGKEAADIAMMGLRPRVPIAPPAAPVPGPLGVTLSEGQLTRELPAIQREQAALRNQSGDRAHARAEDFYDQQRGQLKTANERVAETFDPFNQRVVETPQEAGDLVSQTVRDTATARKADVTKAYDFAKGLPGEIHADAFRDIGKGIKADLSAGTEPVIIDDKLTPFASKAIQDVDNRISQLIIQNRADPLGQPDPNKIVGINLNGVDQMRRRLSTFRRDAYASGNAADGRAARAVLNAFDERVDSAVNGGLFNGDPRAVNAWNAARAAHTDYRSTFGAGKNDPVGRVVERIIGKDKNPPAIANDVADFIYGTSGVNPSSLNVGVAKRLGSILGQQSPEWSAIKQGLFSRLTEAGQNIADWGPKKIGDRVNKFLNVDGREMANVLFSPTERAMLQKYADIQRQLEVPQAGANWSNTATFMANSLKNVGSMVGLAIGSALGHKAGLPWGVAEGAALGLTMAARKGAELIQARAVARQMPLVAEELKRYQAAMAAAIRSNAPLSSPAVMLANANLARTMSRLSASFPGWQAAGVGRADDGQNQIPGPPSQHKDGGRVNEEHDDLRQYAEGGEVKGYKHLPLSHNIEDRRGSYEDHALGHQYDPDSPERLRPGRIAGNAARRFDSKGRAEADQVWRDDPVNANALALRQRGGPVRRYAEGGDVDDAPAGMSEAYARRLFRRNPRPQAPEDTSPSQMVDFAKSIPSGLLKGFSSYVAGYNNNPISDITGARAELDRIPPALDQMREHVPHPETRLGHYGESIGEVAGNPFNWIGPGGIGVKAAWNAAAGAGSEAGGQLYEGTPFEKAARLIGSWSPMAAERMSLGYKMMPEGSAGVFGGRLAQTADHAALAKAESMAKAGAPREDIWKTTGWFQGNDGKWRFEIPDAAAKLDVAAGKKVGDVLDHPELFSAYPDLAKVGFKTIDKNASYMPPTFPFREKISLGAGAPEEKIGPLLHEVQHAIQRREGFDRGTNPLRELDALQTAPWYRPFAQLREAEMNAPKALANYFNAPGEREAYNVAARRPLTPSERSASPPWATEDPASSFFQDAKARRSQPPVDDAIKFGSLGPEMSVDKPSGIRAYHASPHDFDAFDMSKLGTGIGHAYRGEGMNFTTNEAKALAMREQYFPQGKVYEVNLNVNPESLLKFDKPISAQPNLQSAVSSAGAEVWSGLPPFARKNLTGYDALKELENMETPQWRQILNDQRISTSQEGTRKHLLASGIPGSVSADHHVIFDDKLIDILRKYGLVGLPAGAAALGAMQPQEQRAKGGRIKMNKKKFPHALVKKRTAA